jgi:hypothetical protein
MQLKKRPISRKKRAASRSREPYKRSKRPLPWDADSAGRGGPTSQDVLLHWLSQPGNYARWHQGKRKRTDATLDVLRTLEINGLTERTVGAIDSKIQALVQQYLASVTLLSDEGVSSDYLMTDEVDEALERIVLRQCPLFRELEPALRGFDFAGVAPKDWTTCEDSADSDYEEEAEGCRLRHRARRSIQGC